MPDRTARAGRGDGARGTASPDLTDLCKRAVAGAVDADVEAYALESRRTQVRARQGEVESLTVSESRGVGIRAIVEGRVGYGYGADPGESEVDALVAGAVESAGFAEPDPANVLPSVISPEPLPGLYRESQASAGTDPKVRLALDLERVAISTHRAVRKVESASFGDAVSRVVIASTRGGPVEYARTDCWASASALAEANGETQTGFAFRVAREAGELEWEDAAREAAERAARLLGGVKPATERVPVVLDPVAAAAFLGVLVGTLSAESVQKGRSPLAGLTGQDVATRLVTLIDDGRLPDGPAAAPFDDEGVGTRRTPLIQAGVLKGYLHNTYTAAKGGARSTGNAGRPGYRGVPVVSPTNLFLEAGASSWEEILGEAGRAVYVQEVSGLHSGANPVSGEFSVGAVGLRVDGGELAEPLREMTIASTLLQVLQAIAAVGSDLRFVGGIGAPPVLVGEMTVGGR
jgi:PmbA protein